MYQDDVIKLNAELSLLLAEYWHEIDTNGGRNASSYYTDDAEFHGSNPCGRRRPLEASYHRVGREAREHVSRRRL